MTRVQLLEKSNEDECESLVLDSREGMLFHSLRYRDAIAPALEGATPKYLVALDKGKIVGCLPCFVKTDKKWGAVLNSLPFSGSHGGFVVDPGMPRPERLDVRKKLSAALESLEVTHGALASTVITSPLDPEPYLQLREWSHALVEDRIAQILELPNNQANLLSRFSKNSRNAVARAKKAGLTASWTTDATELERLSEGQEENMNKLGGKAKPLSFFMTLREHFEPGDGFRVYRADKGSETIARLLVFYYKHVVEYYTPVVDPNHRNLSAMNLLIHEVATDAIARGFKFLNFGGTRKGMSGVYRFKSSFGAVDHPYMYVTKMCGNRSALEQLGKEGMSRRYPWFFVFPFAELEKTKAEEKIEE